MKCAVEALTLSTPLRVVRGRPRLLDAVQITQLLDNYILEAAALVRVQLGGDTILVDPFLS